jgi:hypothetical protein
MTVAGNRFGRNRILCYAKRAQAARLRPYEYPSSIPIRFSKPTCSLGPARTIGDLTNKSG